MKSIYILLILIFPLFAFSQPLQMRVVGATIKISDTMKVEIDGNFRLFGNAKIDNDGLMEIDGYFINSGTSQGFINRNNLGEVYLQGMNSPTIIAGASPIYFEKLVLNNTQNINNQIDIFIENELELINGKINSENDFITILNTDENALIGFDNTHYINGKMRQYIESNKTYDFPIGTMTNYELATIGVTNTGNIPFIEVEFITGNFLPSNNLILDSTIINEFLDYGYWEFSQTANGVFDVEVTSNGHSNGSGTTMQHALFREKNGIWENAGTHNNVTQSGNLTNAITAKRSDVQGLGNFIIGKGDYVISTNPNLHQNFKFVKAFDFGSNLNIEFIGIENTTYNVHLIDLNGRILATQNIDKNSTLKQVDFNIANLPSSLYFISITSQDFLFTHKVFLN
jgi:hypothetical protein